MVNPDIRRLQILNDLVAQTLEAINVRSAATGGLSHTPADALQAMNPYTQYGAVPYGQAQFGQQQPGQMQPQFGQQFGGQFQPQQGQQLPLHLWQQLAQQVPG